MRQSELKRGKPRRRSKADKERWESAWEPRCRLCMTGLTHTLHHVVYQQHVRSHGGDEWDPANAYPICWDCHTEHHHSGSDWRVPVDALLACNRDFADELLGKAADDYFDRYYDTSERRAA